MNQSQYDAGRGQTVTQSIFFEASEIMSPYLCHDPVTSCDTPSIRDGPRILKPSQHGAFDPPPIAVIRTPGLFHSLVTKSRLPRHDCIEKITTYDKSKKHDNDLYAKAFKVGSNCCTFPNLPFSRALLHIQGTVSLARRRFPFDGARPYFMSWPETKIRRTFLLGLCFYLSLSSTNVDPVGVEMQYQALATFIYNGEN